MLPRRRHGLGRWLERHERVHGEVAGVRPVRAGGSLRVGPVGVFMAGRALPAANAVQPTGVAASRAGSVRFAGVVLGTTGRPSARPGQPPPSAYLPRVQAELGRDLRDGVHRDPSAVPHQPHPDLRRDEGAAGGVELLFHRFGRMRTVLVRLMVPEPLACRARAGVPRRDSRPPCLSRRLIVVVTVPPRHPGGGTHKRLRQRCRQRCSAPLTVAAGTVQVPASSCGHTLEDPVNERWQ